jgi:hypothetical protein
MAGDFKRSVDAISATTQTDTVAGTFRGRRPSRLTSRAGESGVKGREGGRARAVP